MSDVQLVETFENYTYSAKDIFISEDGHRFNPVYENDKIVELLDVSSNQSVKVIPYFVNEYNWLAPVIVIIAMILKYIYLSIYLLAPALYSVAGLSCPEVPLSK